MNKAPGGRFPENSNCARALINKGKLYERAGKTAEALQCYTKASTEYSGNDAGTEAEKLRSKLKSQN